MANATTYEEWALAAAELDKKVGTAWRTSDSDVYDFRLITARTRDMVKARGDIAQVAYLLRSGLLRNLGGIIDKRLYDTLYRGTKKVIEDYVHEVLLHIDLIRDNNTHFSSVNQKVEFFAETRQSYGTTALLLHGGATFGLFHLGVVRALHLQGLLPRVISGKSVGALIAALVCIHTSEELPDVFEQPNGINLEAFSTKTAKGNIGRKLTRLFTHGYLLDVKVLEECVKINLKDVTFEEAYLRTKMVLNITVTSARKNEVPRVLNYLTAPNVLVRSAAIASAASSGFYEPVDMLAKDPYNQLYVWSPTAIKWGADLPSRESESSESRITELFNVNFFILSEATPFLAPFIATDLRNTQVTLSTKYVKFIGAELKYRVKQIGQWGLIPNWIVAIFDQKIQADITIAPELKSEDFSTIFSNPTYSTIPYWTLKGEKSTWPLISMIKKCLDVENKLYDVSVQLKAELDRSVKDQADAPLLTVNNKRTRSFA